MKKLLSLIFVLALSLVMVACTKGKQPAEFKLELSASSTNIKVGTVVELQALVKKTGTEDKTPETVTYTSSNPAVLLVTGNKVEGKAKGEATVTATTKLEDGKELTATLKFTVRAISTFTVGTTTEPNANFFGTFWDNNASNARARELANGYNTVAYQKEEGKYLVNPTIVKDMKTVNNTDGSKTYEIEIHNDLLWSDGTAIDAKDYVFAILFSINPILKKATDAKNSTDGTIVGSKDYNDATKNPDGKAELTGVDLLGDYKFSVTIGKDNFPYYYEFLYYSVAPYPLHVLAPNADVAQGTEGAKITGAFDENIVKQTVEGTNKDGYRYKISVTAGPYVLYNYDAKTSTISMKKNPYYKGNYEGQKPDIDNIVIRYTPQTTQLQALLNGEVDIISGISGGESIKAGLDAVAADNSKVTFTTYSRNGYGHIAFHADEAAGAISSANVRQSIAYLINRDLFLTTYTSGYGVLPNGQYGLAQWMVAASQDENGVVQGRDKDGNLVALEKYSYNPAKAVELLEADGWNLDLNGNPYVQGTDTFRYKRINGELVKLSIPWGNSEGNPVSELIRTQLLPNAKSVGMEILDNTMDFNTLLLRDYYGVYGDGYLAPEKNENGDWVIPEYQAKDEQGNVIEKDERKNFMVNLGTGFNTGLFEPYYDVSIEYWGYDGGANYSHIYDKEMLEAAYDMMRAANDDEYLEAWQRYQLRYNVLLPSLPLYSDLYHDFYSKALKNFNVTAEWVWTWEILYSTFDK